jgi:hypothetical protein
MGMRFFVYLTVNNRKEELWLQTGDQQYAATHYIGSKSIHEKNYLGSSKPLLRDIELYGKNAFTQTVICELIENNRNVLLELEREIQLQYDVVNSPRFYNKTYATLHFSSQGLSWYHNIKTGEREKFKNIDDVPDGWIPGSGYSGTTGKVAYHDSITQKIIYLDCGITDVPKNLIKGLPSGKTTGLTWWHNLLNPSERKLADVCPDGWEKGMGDFKNHAKKGKSFKYYYHPSDPTKWIQIVSGDPVPNELVEGRAGNGRQHKWWHEPANPTDRKLISVFDTPPEGWVHGNSNNWSNGLLWYHDPQNKANEVRINSTDVPPTGWIRGRGIKGAKQNRK